jgi:hypothetical protein
MANYDELMNELYESPEYQTWCDERNAELIAHMEEDFAEEGGEGEDPDMEEYTAFFLGMAELVAMNTAHIADRGQNGLN